MLQRFTGSNERRRRAPEDAQRKKNFPGPARKKETVDSFVDCLCVTLGSHKERQCLFRGATPSATESESGKRTDRGSFEVRSRKAGQSGTVSRDGFTCKWDECNETICFVQTESERKAVSILKRSKRFLALFLALVMCFSQVGADFGMLTAYADEDLSYTAADTAETAPAEELDGDAAAEDTAEPLAETGEEPDFAADEETAEPAELTGDVETAEENAESADEGSESTEAVAGSADVTNETAEAGETDSLAEASFVLTAAQVYENVKPFENDDLTLTLDGTNSYNDVSSYYSPMYADQGTMGSINYQLSDLAPGMHTLRLRVWDVFNNVGEKTITFKVVNGLAPTISDVYCAANPASVETSFYVKHNRPDAVVSVTIEVYDLMGRLVWNTTQSGRSDMYTSTPVTWDLTDRSGRRVPRGIYVYRATITTDGVKEATKAKKLAVTGE